MRFGHTDVGLLLCGALIILSFFVEGCPSGERNAAQSPNPLESQRANVTHVTSHETPYNGDIYTKQDGWQIPDLSASTIETDSYKHSRKGRCGVEVANKIYRLKETIVTSEPFDSIGMSLGKTQISMASEYLVRDRPFCYKFQVNRAEVDDSNVVVSSSGSLFFYSYYDEDGDGNFETLILDEKDKSGITSFWNRPHLPDWVDKDQ